MIFAREVSDPLTGLVKKLDAEVAKNKKMAACVIFLTDDSQAEAKIKEMAKEHGIKRVSLAVDKPAGPYEGKAAVAKDAEVTVILYAGRKVKVNHAFKLGDFTPEAADHVLADLPKIIK